MGPSARPKSAYQTQGGQYLIGAVHIQGPLSHLPSHVQRHISHSPPLGHSPEGMGVVLMDGMGAKGGFAGSTGFGMTPYADAEALSKLREHPAWESEVQTLIPQQLVSCCCRSSWLVHVRKSSLMICGTYAHAPLQLTPRQYIYQ